jgi:hypothetical protein
MSNETTNTPPKPWYQRGWVLGVAGILILLVGIGIGGAGKEPTATTVVDAAGTTTEPETTTTTTEPTTTTTEATTTTTEATTTTQPPTTTTTQPTTTTTRAFNEEAYSEIADRDYELLVRNADEHVGERIIIYGRVWQFDNATGPTYFLADTAGTQQEDWFDYEIQAAMQGTADMFSNVVEDDIFKAWVTVMGSQTYETAIGGENTVPLFSVGQIEVIGSTE